MILCIQCSAEQKRQMDDLVKDGGYQDYSELIAVAVTNLVAMHKNIGPTGSYIFPGSLQDGVQSLREVGTSDSAVAPNSAREGRDKPKESTARVAVPLLFSLNETLEKIERIDSHLQKAPESKSPERIPISQWLFGQYNRLLPLVATTRALAQVIAEAGGPVRLSDVAMKIASDALELGEYLAGVDKDCSLPRDSATAVAFPHKRKGQQKAVLRFASQFVGDTTSTGRLTGMLAEYRFLVVANGAEDHVTMTNNGRQFATLKNPIFDSERPGGAERLSAEQVDFLIDHVTQHVPAEKQAFDWLLNAIESGVNSPSKLDELIIAQPELMKSERPISDAFVSSQRSGAIARMCDLNLIKRLRDGVKATYAVTERGQQYLTGY